VCSLFGLQQKKSNSIIAKKLRANEKFAQKCLLKLNPRDITLKQKNKLTKFVPVLNSRGGRGGGGGEEKTLNDRSESVHL
jgi:hypothetical protein